MQTWKYRLCPFRVSFERTFVVNTWKKVDISIMLRAYVPMQEYTPLWKIDNVTGGASGFYPELIEDIFSRIGLNYSLEFNPDYDKYTGNK